MFGLTHEIAVCIRMSVCLYYKDIFIFDTCWIINDSGFFIILVVRFFNCVTKNCYKKMFNSWMINKDNKLLSFLLCHLMLHRIMVNNRINFDKLKSFSLVPSLSFFHWVDNIKKKLNILTWSSWHMQIINLRQKKVCHFNSQQLYFQINY